MLSNLQTNLEFHLVRTVSITTKLWIIYWFQYLHVNDYRSSVAPLDIASSRDHLKEYIRMRFWTESYKQMSHVSLTSFFAERFKSAEELELCYASVTFTKDFWYRKLCNYHHFFYHLVNTKLVMNLIRLSWLWTIFLRTFAETTHSVRFTNSIDIFVSRFGVFLVIPWEEKY